MVGNGIPAGVWRAMGAGLARFRRGGEGTSIGDFTTTMQVIPIALLAILIGALGACGAFLLLALIGLFTNLFFFQRPATALVSPAGNQLGLLVILVPVFGGLIVGLIARFGSERIRGHGIPEAIEAILFNRSQMQVRVAILKPLASAIAIGSGGPFGAEGPIIMTGGAIGSIIAQFFRLTSAERKTLLVAGAAAGMSAIFATPVAAVLLAVELLLFEWKPRSLVPVALASATAAAIRSVVLGLGPLFPTGTHPPFVGFGGLAACVIAGLLAGLLSTLLTGAVYAAEDAFHRLPVHWMWWPAIGGLLVGLGGFVFPQALGVGYDTIGTLVRGDLSGGLIIGMLLVKSTIWAVALGSGTSGGVLAPLLLMGGAVGGAEALVFPNEGLGFWPLISMGAVLGGVMRSPFTGIVFALELTHDVNALLPLLVAVMSAHVFTVLVLRRSILTEKVSRRGYHLDREYVTDPLEMLFVRDVSQEDFVALTTDASAHELAQALKTGQQLFPVVDGEGKLAGVVTRKDVSQYLQERNACPAARFVHLVISNPVVAFPDETLSAVVYRMAETGRTRLPVVERRDGRRPIAIISLRAVLKARGRHREAELRRERVLGGRVLRRRVAADRDGVQSADVDK